MKDKSMEKGNTNSLFPATPSLMDNFFGRDWLRSAMADWRTVGSTLPAVNVQETNEDYRIEVAAPGLKREDFKVELDNDVLTISSQMENRHDEKDEEGNYTRREFSYQSFRRSFSLPQNKVNRDEIAARYVDGVLYVSVPKSEDAKAKPAKKIAVA